LPCLEVMICLHGATNSREVVCSFHAVNGIRVSTGVVSQGCGNTLWRGRNERSSRNAELGVPRSEFRVHGLSRGRRPQPSFRLPEKPMEGTWAGGLDGPWPANCLNKESHMRLETDNALTPRASAACKYWGVS
jgi:hypothetical protein